MLTKLQGQLEYMEKYADTDKITLLIDNSLL